MKPEFFEDMKRNPETGERSFTGELKIGLAVLALTAGAFAATATERETVNCDQAAQVQTIEDC